MSWFAAAVLLGWLPIVLGTFSVRPPQRAVIAAFITAWMFLPNGGFSIPGFPDYQKMSATTVGVCLGVLIFDVNRLRDFRPSWVDLPMLIFCVVPFFSSISAGTGAYEGCSAILAQLFIWGLPYLIGRVYLADRAGVRYLCYFLMLTALIYIPLFLLEIRFSPQVENRVYGGFRFEPLRYGGFRPRVFFFSGLELSLWLGNVTILFFWTWYSRTERSVRGVPIGLCTLAMFGIMFICKSFGATALMLLGVGGLWFSRKVGRSWPIWIFLAFPSFYESTRVAGLMTGRGLVEVARVVSNEDRVQSFSYRLDMEERILARTRMRPILGYGRFGGYLGIEEGSATDIIPDGYWIIVLGQHGLVGLACVTSFTTLPAIRMVVLRRANRWSDPDCAQAVAVCVVLSLFMIDCISNAMINPIYAMLIGGLIRYPFGREDHAEDPASDEIRHAQALLDQGDLGEARVAFAAIADRTAESPDPADDWAQATAWEGLARIEAEVGDWDRACANQAAATAIWRDLAQGHEDRAIHVNLARSHEAMARFEATRGRSLDAVDRRRAALEIWARLADRNPRDADVVAQYALGMNDLAWLLAAHPSDACHRPLEALTLATRAAQVLPGPVTRNTLGVAAYRAGDWPTAIGALESAIQDGPAEHRVVNLLFLAMASQRAGDPSRARTLLQSAHAARSRTPNIGISWDEFAAEADATIPENGGDLAKLTV